MIMGFFAVVVAVLVWIRGVWVFYMIKITEELKLSRFIDVTMIGLD